MKVLTDTLYKEHCKLYTEIHGSIAVNICQIELAQEDIILLSKVSILVYKTSKRTSVENRNLIHFNLSVGTYSIDNFNAKIKVAILQQRQDWEPRQIKDLNLVIPEHYTFMTDNTILSCLVYKTSTIKRLCQLGQPYPLTHTKHLLIHHLL